MRTAKEDRRVEFRRKMYELAESGRHIDYQTIEAALSFEYLEAREWLDNDSLRRDLKDICDRSRARLGKT